MLWLGVAGRRTQAASTIGLVTRGDSIKRRESLKWGDTLWNFAAALYDSTWVDTPPTLETADCYVVTGGTYKPYHRTPFRNYLTRDPMVVVKP